MSKINHQINVDESNKYYESLLECLTDDIKRYLKKTVVVHYDDETIMEEGAVFSWTSESPLSMNSWELYVQLNNSNYKTAKDRLIIESSNYFYNKNTNCNRLVVKFL